MASYILDTNILIRSKNDMPFDLWPTFWNKMRLMIVNGQVFSCNHVKAEIDGRILFRLTNQRHYKILQSKQTLILLRQQKPRV